MQVYCKCKPYAYKSIKYLWCQKQLLLLCYTVLFLGLQHLVACHVSCALPLVTLAPVNYFRRATSQHRTIINIIYITWFRKISGSCCWVCSIFFSIILPRLVCENLLPWPFAGFPTQFALYLSFLLLINSFINGVAIIH